MPIAPITGKLRKRLWLDLTCALGLGVAAGYAYWYASILRCAHQFSYSICTGIIIISRPVSTELPEN
jgi:cytochrome c oxidase subunit 7